MFQSSSCAEHPGLSQAEKPNREMKRGATRDRDAPFSLQRPFARNAPSRAPLGIRIFARALWLLRRPDRNQLLVRGAQRLVIAESADKSRLRGKFARANQVCHFRDFLLGFFQRFGVTR